MDSDLRKRKSMSRDQVEDKIKGCIYGAALGDAFGLAAEFMSKAKANELYGFGPIKFGDDPGAEFHRDRHRSRWHENDFTDDTDQLLVILKSVLETNGILSPRHFAAKLKTWSKCGFPELRKIPCGIGYTVGSTFSHPKFETKPHLAAYEVWDSNERNLAANGAVMRTAVLGIPFFTSEDIVVSNAINAAKVTHADPRSVVSAVIVSVIVSRLLCGHSNGQPGHVVSQHKMKFEKLLLHGCEQIEGPDSEDDDLVETKQHSTNADSLAAPAVDKSPEQKGFFKKLMQAFRRNDKVTAQYEYQDFQDLYDIPSYDHATPNPNPQSQVPKTLPPPPSMDTFGHEEQMMGLCNQVVQEYQYLLQGNVLCPETGAGAGDCKSSDWVNELKAHCFPESLSALKLDDGKRIGYTFKCLGAGVYSCTRAIPGGMTPFEFFKCIITEITLEGGDADTNCAVAGALLGCRLGFSNLPSKWLNGLRHSEHLEKLSNQLCSFVLHSNQESSET